MTPAQKPIDESTYVGRCAARLRELRNKTGMTGEQAAAAITEAGFQMTPKTYYRWERGERQFDLNAMPVIAGVFGVKPRNIFSLD